MSFSSIFPTCYDGRWPHIHVEVYPDQGSITDATKAVATSQVAILEATADAVYTTRGYEQSVRNMSRVSLSSDNVVGDHGGASQLATVSGDVTRGYALSLAVTIDPSTQPTGGNARRRAGRASAQPLTHGTGVPARRSRSPLR